MNRSRTRTRSAPSGRRAFLLQLGGLGLGALLSGCAGDARQLTVAACPWLGYESLFLARRQGWLDPELVRLAEVPTNAGSLRALTAGIVDGAALTLDEVLRARAEGLDLSIVLVFDHSAGADRLLARPGIDTLAGLRGRRIGLARQTNAALLLAAALHQAGLGFGDVYLVDLALTDQPAAWEQGRVDAVISYGAVADRLLKQGGRRLFDSRQAPNTIVDVLALRAEVLADPAYAPAIRAVLAGHFRGLERLQQQPAEAARQMAPHLSLTAEQVTEAYREVLLPDLAENHRLLGGTPPGLLGQAETLVRYLQTTGLITRPVRLDNLLVPRFLPPEARP
jgi:NitT/TauT family transport system substrate-binding protein